MNRLLTTGLAALLVSCAQNRGPSATPPRIVVVTQQSGGGTDPAGEAEAAPAEESTVGPVAAGDSNGSGSNGWLGGSALRTRILTGSDGENRIGIWVDPPAAAQGVTAAPMSVTLLIDSSGSMRGEKMAQARRAATDLIARMRDGDLVSIYTFATGTTEVSPLVALTPASRTVILRRKSPSIQTSGATNMHEGLVAALRSANSAPATHTLRRVILISDGRANRGAASADDLGGLAATNAVAGLQITTLGVGLDYDEHTLTAISQRSAGRLYHLDDPTQLATALREEIRTLSDAVATDATIEVTAEPGVTLLGVDGASSESEPGRLRVRLGDLRGGRHHEVLVRVRLSTGSTGSHPLAFVRLTCRESTGARAEHFETLALSYAVTANAQAVAAVDGRVETIEAVRSAAALQRRAVEQLNSGDVASADEALDQAQRQLRVAAQPVMPSQSPAPSAAVANLEFQAQAIDQLRARAQHAGSRPASRRAALQANDNAYRSMAEY